MAQGFFSISDNYYLPKEVKQATSSILRFNTGRILHHRLFETEEEANEWSGFICDEDGRETFQAGWTQKTLDALDYTIGGKDWAKGFDHEVITHIANGGSLPYKTPHAGSATATLVSREGHVLTNFHLITTQLWYVDQLQTEEQIKQGYFKKLPFYEYDSIGESAPHIELFTEDHQSLGTANVLYLNPQLDLAVLKLINPPTISPSFTRNTPPKRHEPIWQWGYPPHTSRDQKLREFLGYENASGQLTYSPSLILSDPTQPLWYTDADFAFGSSGSTVVGSDGAILGVRCGGGARMLNKSDWFNYNRTIDVYSLKTLLPPEVFSHE